MVLKKPGKVTLLIVTSIFASVLSGLPEAFATPASVPTGSIGLYMDKPFVQGSYASSPSTKTETFDSLEVDPVSETRLCSSVNTIEIGELLPTCTIHGSDSAASETFSASTSIGSETVGGINSGFLTSHPGQGYSVIFDTQKKYVGFWWATASAGNVVRFYSNSSLVAEISIDGVNSLIGSAPVDDPSYASDTSSVTSIGGDQYLKKYYFGNPRHYTNFTPTTLQTANGSIPTEAFVYIHAFAGDDVGFNRIEFVTSGSGFEIDNLTASNESIEINQRLVYIQDFQTQGTYSGLATSSGSGQDWINLKGTQLARTSPTSPGYQTVYWIGRDTSGNWSSPMDLEATGGTVRNHASGSSIDVLLPNNTFTHIIFWVDWCADLTNGPCLPFHYGESNVALDDRTYRYQRIRRLSYQVIGSGSIQGISNQSVTYGGDGSSVTAIPATGGRFIRWSDDFSNPPSIPATRLDLNVTEDISVTAEFEVLPNQQNPTSSLATKSGIQSFELTGFAFERSKINKVVETNLKQIAQSVEANFSGIISCQGQTGFNWNNRPEVFLRFVANWRAKRSCQFLDSEFPNAQIKILSPLKSASKDPSARKVHIIFSN